MSFLFPLAFLGSLAVPVIIALYLRLPARRTQEVPSLLLWQRLFDKAPHKKFLGRLRNLFSLLLALVILASVLLALAKPVFFQNFPSSSTVIILDQRARMQAGSTFKDGISLARRIAGEASARGEVAILGISGIPWLISPFSSDAADLRTRLSLLTPTDGGGSLDASLELARRMLKSRDGNKRLLLITDRPVSDFPPEDLLLVGEPRENAAILSLAQRPLPSSPQTREILVKLGNFSSQPRDVEFEILLDDRPIDLQTQRIEPGGQTDFTLVLPAEKLRRGHGLLTAHLAVPDGLAPDNTAYARITGHEALRVLLLTEGNPYLESALRADPGVKMDILTPDQWRTGMGSHFDAVLWDGNLPANTSLQSLGPGNFLFLGQSPFTASDSRAPVTPPLSILETSRFLSYADLARVDFAYIRKMHIPGNLPVRVVAESGGEPLIATLETPDRQRIIATAFDIPGSNFPLRAGFPLFINQCVYWLAHRDKNESSFFRSGEVIAPQEGMEIARLPGGTTASEFTNEPFFLAKNGFYATRSKDATGWIAASTANAEESDLRQASRTASSFLSIAAGAWEPWQWLAAAALILLLAEWALFHRRITE